MYDRLTVEFDADLVNRLTHSVTASHQAPGALLHTNLLISSTLSMLPVQARIVSLNWPSRSIRLIVSITSP